LEQPLISVTTVKTICQTPRKRWTDGQTPRRLSVRRFVMIRSDVDTARRQRSRWTLLPCVFVRRSVS